MMGDKRMVTLRPDTQSPRWATEVAQLWPPQGQWTETAYFELPDTNRIVELSERELILMRPPSFTHQRVLDNLYALLKTFVQENGLGATAFAPLAVRLWPGKIREPDILFYAAVHRDRIGEWVSGPPDLAMEIISPGTRKTDRQEKFYEYAQAGIAEYWLVDPDGETVEVYALVDGVYELHERGHADGRVTSRLLAGFAVALADIFAAPQ
jgi:Uma2 family endonuclease